ncbi:hypothetical protein KC238_11915 [Mycobacteroides chelonae]|nr:hypothetical protein [Mycobacteroides chelonae]MBV0917962.1 hypothetical protein [Mycobacteroides chelonae]QQG95600.1 hypothetical protein HBE99_00860 [Mycobacteroides chelonae]
MPIPLPYKATAGPVDSKDPQMVINDLQSEGYRVIVSRNGSGNLAACSVSSTTTQTSASDVQPTRRMRNQPAVPPPPRRKIAYITLAC